ncbi:MAG: S9 family peptidase [Candidatus Electryonea clarkiae]|nr:S9 family peptidase [Candidatus Electryonea clarkiae]MDP8287830.1 S9 family peptidase [Candidatus Electryonea clarkiae]
MFVRKGIVLGSGILLLVFAGLMISSCSTTTEKVELIPLEVLFGNPDKVTARMSPKGDYLTYVAPYEGVLNIWIRTIGKDDDQPLTKDKGRGIRKYKWAYNGEQVIYVQDQDGDENWRIYAVDVATSKVLSLIPADPAIKHKVQAQLLASIPERPNEVLIGLNKRNERMHDVYLLNLRTGNLKLVEKSNPQVLGWQIDHNLVIRGFTRANPDGGQTLLLRVGDKGPFNEIISWGSEDMLGSGVVGFTADNNSLYIIDSRNRNAGALIEYEITNGNIKVIAEDEQYDISGIETHPTEHTVQAVVFQRDKADWQIIDASIQADIDLIQQTNPGDFNITNRTLDDKKWMIAYDQDNGPVKYYLYDRDAAKLEFLFNHREALVGMPLVSMKPIQFTSQDGLEIHGYLTVPKNWKGPGPMVLNVHGGPWHRDTWGYNPEAQWMANRGYACLQVNFRSSTGYGKKFTNAGDREWGGKIQNDLTDAVKWAISEGIADPEKVVIYGGSFGGYATLAGVTFTPDLYTAGVSIVGPSNLETFLNTIPPYWESFRKVMDQRVGKIPRYDSGHQTGQPKVEADFTSDEKKEIDFLHSRSPLFHVNNVKVPMLIAQGANDPRVNKAESDQFVQAMKDNGLKVEYVVYENEGHGFARPENRMDFYRRTEKFLAEQLGGRCEEVPETETTSTK